MNEEIRSLSKELSVAANTIKEPALLQREATMLLLKTLDELVTRIKKLEES